MPTPLAITCEHRRNSAVIHVVGEVDGTNAVILDQVLAQTMHDGACLVIDLSTMPFLDNTGLNVILHAHQNAEQHGSHLYLAPPAAPDDHRRRPATPARLRHRRRRRPCGHRRLNSGRGPRRPSADGPLPATSRPDHAIAGAGQSDPPPTNTLTPGAHPARDAQSLCPKQLSGRGSGVIPRDG
ncbi:STAS domain-containing protein [Nonomuraea sp. NPDC050540]|uniref:STAS domain-containing protein n=1 Tax=Nonomuraea sp. NPDC050540 TaxID=3364367 RepID=UPI00378BF17E